MQVLIYLVDFMHRPLSWPETRVKASNFTGTWYFVQKLIEVNKKEAIKPLHYWTFVLGIHC